VGQERSFESPLFLHSTLAASRSQQMSIFHKIVLTCRKKQMIDSAKIGDIAMKIANKFNPEQIILFGSYAKGTQSKGSDIDLLIIQDTELPSYKRGIDIRLSLIGTKMPIDILVYTRNEFEKEKNDKYSFLFSAIKTSKILYERTN